MKYDLKDKWLVVVDLKVTLDQQKIEWSFNFTVDSEITFVEIWKIAQHIAKEKIGQLGWQITKVSLTTFSD